MKTVVLLLPITKTTRARTIPNAMTATQILVTDVDAKKVMQEIPTCIPMVAQVHFYSFNVLLYLYRPFYYCFIVMGVYHQNSIYYGNVIA